MLPLIGLALLATLVGACSAPATVDESESDGGGAAASAGVPEALQKVYDAVDGQTGDQRRQTLVDLAKQEGGEVSYYSTTAPDDLEPVLKKFEEDTGVKVNLYAGGNAAVAQRVLQEQAANRIGADVIQAGTSELQLMVDEDVLANIESPFREEIVEAGRGEKWLSPYVVARLVAWNTNNVSDPPKTLEDVFTKHKGKLALAVGDWDWFATVVRDYLVAKKGMTEEAAIEMIREGAKGATVQDDFTLGAQLLAAGEVDVYPEMFHHYLPDFLGDGAPIAWEPAVQPLFLASVGASITNGVKHPAAALLLVEYLLSDAQPILAENGRTVANTNYEGGLDPDKYEIVPIPDAASFGEDAKKWEDLWTDILQSK